MMLTSMGFEVETAVNGREAVDKVMAAEPGHYDAVLMDIQMPVMNGYEATELIRSLPEPELASLPIIAITANAFAEDVQKALDVGMNGHIAKPLDKDNIRRVLKEVFDCVYLKARKIVWRRCIDDTDDRMLYSFLPCRDSGFYHRWRRAHNDPCYAGSGDPCSLHNGDKSVLGDHRFRCFGL